MPKIYFGGDAAKDAVKAREYTVYVSGERDLPHEVCVLPVALEDIIRVITSAGGEYKVLPGKVFKQPESKTNCVKEG